MGAKLVLITIAYELFIGTKLGDLGWRNIALAGADIISPNSVAFGTDCVKVVEDSAAEICRPKNIAFSDRPISFMAILPGDHPREQGWLD